jgi:putative endonuclease
MASHNELGSLGEGIATDFLRKSGYEILEKNWVWGKAEVDIIAQKGSVLVAVEVKTRSDVVFGLPQDFVNRKKIRMMAAAVDAYVDSRGLDVNVRFDIVAVHRENGGFVTEHFEDAFYHF